MAVKVGREVVAAVKFGKLAIVSMEIETSRWHWRETHLASIWRISDIQELLHPAWSLGNGASVSEGVERRLSTVSTLSGVTDTAEWHGRDGAVEERIVDGCATAGNAGQNLGDFLLVAESVEAQWSGVDVVGDPDGLVEVLDLEDRHQWAEGLVDDEGVVLILHHDDGRLDVVLGLVRLASDNDFALGGIKHLLDSVEMIVGDNACEIRRCLCTLWVEFLHGDLHLLDEGVDDFFVDHGVVLRDTDLSCIEELAPKETTSSKAHVGVLGDNGWVTATELEGNGCECLSGLFGNDSADLSISSVEDLVPLQVQESRGFILAAIDNSKGLGIQILLHNLRQDHCCRRADLARLQNRRATRRNSANERSKTQLDREIPASDDQHGAEGLLADDGAHQLVRQAHIRRSLVLRPLLEVLGDEDDVILDPLDLGDLGLEGRFLEVELAGFKEGGGVVDEAPVELAQLLDAVGEGACLLGAVGRLDVVDDG